MRYILGLEANAITVVQPTGEQADALIDELRKSANGATRKVGQALFDDVPSGTPVDLTVDLDHAQLTHRRRLPDGVVVTNRFARPTALTFEQLQRDIRIINRVRKDLGDLDVQAVICFFVHDQPSVGPSMYAFGTDALEVFRAGATRDDFVDIVAAPNGEDVAVIATIFSTHPDAIDMIGPLLIESGAAIAVVQPDGKIAISAKASPEQAAAIVKKINANQEGQVRINDVTSSPKKQAPKTELTTGAIATRAELAGQEYSNVIAELQKLLDGAHHPTSTAVGQDLVPLTRAVLRFGRLVSYDADRAQQFDDLLHAIDLRASEKRTT